MKILIVNKFFYPRGGDCIVAMSTRQLLIENGHQVRVFSMTYPDNIDIPDAKSYASQISFSSGIINKIKGAKRILGLGDIRNSFENVINEFKPDVVHLHNIHSYLSPVIGEIAHKHDCRVVWTLHDYKLLCPAYAFRRTDGYICEECIHSGLKVFKNRCMKGSAIQSLLADIEARVWNKHRLEKSTYKFIAPSHFMRNKMLEGGFHHDKIVTLHNFIDPAKADKLAKASSALREDYFCYIGRLSEEKGVETLLKAAAEAGVKLKLAGEGPLAAKLKNQYCNTENIEFLGHLDADSIVNLLSKAKASILPSEWFENNPLSVIESLCAGTPVIGAAIGGISELISENDGVLFSSGNAEELSLILKGFHRRHPFSHYDIAQRACAKFSRKAHYDALMKIYSGKL
ncbi:MAG: glycosyltransferase [Prevotella sp.]|nr:glycosyltransferase [Bacteroides sp.]MCM1366856.1 glycosyltransferase [Prevotella sp.]MCM1437418.1 glycosyltransferase [Prevotella sp.]